MTEKMKPSGIAWIGDIPQDWDCKRYRFCGNVQYGYPFNSDYFTTEETGFPLIRIRDITSGEIATYYEGSYPEEYIVKNGDVLVGMDGDFNVRVWKNCDALLNQRCCRVFDSQQISKRFMAYYLPHYLKVINDLTWSTTVKHLLADDINNIYVSYPEMSEQQAIADFLDAQCAKIDSVIADIEKQIETLQKYKKSLITEAVTKGLNRSVPMKDSGFEWVPHIPTTWVIDRLGNASNLRNGYVGPTKDILVDEGEPYIQSLHVKNGKIVFGDDFYVTAAWGKHHPKIVKGDILLVQTGEIGQIALVDEQFDGCNCHALIICSPDITRIYPAYLLYYLMSSVGNSQLMIYQTGTTLKHLNSTKIKNAKVIIPPVEVQKEIAEHLDMKTKRIDAIIETKQKQIETMLSHKKSLIYEYVTGKKRVTEVN